MRVLVFNCGSSSLKFELVELEQGGRSRRSLARGRFEEIGAPNAKCYLSIAGKTDFSGAVKIADHAAAAVSALEWLSAPARNLLNGLDVIGHRVVHGGEEIREPVEIDEHVMTVLQRAAEFAPLHNPPAIAAINAVRDRMKGRKPVRSIVVADTAFHQTMPPYASQYAIPRDLARRLGIRRFGFHGIGHAWMMERYAELTGTSPAKLNLVTLHLGAGCSAAAIRAGQSIDTSMGMTPLEGLMMGTRCGDIDPSIVSLLALRGGKSLDDVDRILNRDSGLLGVSGISADMREVQAANERNDANAALAIEMFCYRVRKYIGAYVAALGWANAIIFGGGIGENAGNIRERICTGLEWLGVELDLDRNRSIDGIEGRISTAGSRMKVFVIPLDEELYIARAALRVVASGGR